MCIPPTMPPLLIMIACLPHKSIFMISQWFCMGCIYIMGIPVTLLLQVNLSSFTQTSKWAEFKLERLKYVYMLPHS